MQISYNISIVLCIVKSVPLILSCVQVRRRSKACRAGLKEYDELIAIGHHMCAELSHAEAMSLIDTQSATLSLRVKRSERH